MTNTDYKLKPFRFWCQKVLPLVYDDSLSYYELLCKVVDYINNLMKDMTEAEEAIVALDNYVKNYFANLDVQDEIDNKLDEMVADGTLTAIIAQYMDELILPSTHDTTDRTAEIYALLSTKGVCRLGTGDFYVSNLNMIPESSLIGSGNQTRIVLSGTGDGYAVRLATGSHVESLAMTGSLTNLSGFGINPGGRHGIEWVGSYSVDGSCPKRGYVRNVHIQNFNGGGIYMYDTGFDPEASLMVSDTYIRWCWAGIYNRYWSEYSKFVNVKCGGCRIGCYNNGGNNVFTNCDFSMNEEINLLIYNPNNEMMNIGHGTFSSCLFNHPYSGGVANSGVAISIVGNPNGEIFTGCSVYFGRIEITNSDGIVFDGMNYGYSNCDIVVSGGGLVLFSNMQMQGAVTKTITNNEHVVFSNCYIRSTGAAYT